MNLTFTVKVDVADDVGEQYVDYVKYLLSRAPDRLGRVQVTYEKGLTDSENKMADLREMYAYEMGEMEI